MPQQVYTRDNLMVAIANKDEKCQRIEALISSGMGVCASCREVGISEKTFYRWRQVAEALGNANV